MASYYTSIIKPFILVLLLLISTSSLSERHPCLTEQQNALLQVKDSFVSTFSQCYDASFGERITASWKNDTDCCMWDGVTCNIRTGDVISLDISCLGVTGFISNSSSLLLLKNLQSLNLSYNDLSGSLNFLGQLPSLMHLDLSFNGFSGIIPCEITHLTQLVSFNLSGNNLTFTSSLLELLIQNLTHVQELNLKGVRMSAAFPRSLLNLSTTLTSLTLSDCSLKGRFPDYIFHLPNLHILDVSDNLGLTGTLPKLNWSSSLIYLDLSSTGFSGYIPNSIGNLKNLENLDLHSCHFTNSIPSSICGLTSLQVLVSNRFSGFIPECLGNLTNLQKLDMSHNQLLGPLPQSLNKCTLLEHVNVSSNMLSDTFPFLVGRLPNLNVVDLGQNKFYGPIGSLFNGSRLSIIVLHQNDFSGHLPDFDGNLSLAILDLSSNSLEGPIPKLPQVSALLILSNNKCTGEIPLSICNLEAMVLDLSNNSLNGTIPPCLLNKTYTFGGVIILGKNKLEGAIPDMFTKHTNIKALDLSRNQLKGPLPCSMVNSCKLVFLDLSYNNIDDSFPNWLETLPELQVLALQSNKFNGEVNTLSTDHPFPNLRLFDLSNNNLTGLLPIEYISHLNAMKNADIYGKNPQYLVVNAVNIDIDTYFLTITLTMKGSRLKFLKISMALTSIDFSNNNFQGEIPQVIGELVALKGLNLSHNNLTGSIPLSFQNLTSLEWLDLSSNKLNGHIPRGLTHLIELSSLNLSYNNLTGMIPSGRQLDTFVMESFVGNMGLWGSQVTKACGDNAKQPQPPLPPAEEDDSNEFDWDVILMGYVCGLVIGVPIGYIVFELRRPN